MNHKNFMFEMFFVECYEEMIIERVNQKLKTFSQGLDEALDKMEEDSLRDLADEMREDDLDG